jgi:hypothetical protein
LLPPPLPTLAELRPLARSLAPRPSLLWLNSVRPLARLSACSLERQANLISVRSLACPRPLSLLWLNSVRSLAHPLSLLWLNSVSSLARSLAYSPLLHSAPELRPLDRSLVRSLERASEQRGVLTTCQKCNYKHTLAVVRNRVGETVVFVTFLLPVSGSVSRPIKKPQSGKIREDSGKNSGKSNNKVQGLTQDFLQMLIYIYI